MRFIVSSWRSPSCSRSAYPSGPFFNLDEVVSGKSASGVILEERPGFGVDAQGRQVVDPTENVKALVEQEKQHGLELRHLQDAHLEAIRSADTKRSDDLRSSDKEWADKFASMKERYDDKIFNIQTVQVKTTSDLISAQLSKETGSLSNQITAASAQTQMTMNIISGRVDKLEQQRWEVAGRQSVSDPATAEALRSMAAAVEGLSSAKDKQTGGNAVWAAVAVIITIIIAATSVGVMIVTRVH